jgi:CubicO group peptidase (beta-lactamase class C family)
LKNIFYTLVLLAIVYSCNRASSAKHDDPIPEDSLQFYAPTPTAMDQREFRKYVRELNTFFQTHLNNGFNGSILIAKDGHTLYEKYIGYADMRTKEVMTDSTPIHIASTSKTFTAAAILGLVQQGKLSLSDSIQRFFPGLPYPGVTVKTLLNHRSGLPNYLYFMDKSENWDKKKMATNNDVLQTLYTMKPDLYFKANRRFSYCNTNFVLLALIVEKISGMSFPEYLQKTIFGPLQMKHTFVYTMADTGRIKVVTSYNYNNTVWKNDFLEGTYGDKNVYTTPKDLLKWDQALYTENILCKDMLDSAFTPYSLEKPSIHNYGLGFRMLLLKNGKKVIYHFGRWHGFNAAFARLTDEKATIIILGNKFNRGIYSTAHKLYDVFGNYGQDKDHDFNNEDDDNDGTKSVVLQKTIAVSLKNPLIPPSRF